MCLERLRVRHACAIPVEGHSVKSGPAATDNNDYAIRIPHQVNPSVL